MVCNKCNIGHDKQQCKGNKKTNTRKQANNLKRHNKQTKTNTKNIVSPIGMGFLLYKQKFLFICFLFALNPKTNPN